MLEKLHRNNLDVGDEAHQEEQSPESEAQTESAHRERAEANANRQVQHLLSGEPSLSGDQQHEVAAEGVAGGGAPLPHLDRIQSSFGQDLGDVRAHVGGRASEAADAMGAEAYAFGSDVAFRGAPDLHTTAHEAAHVVQQRAGIDLARGVGKRGDSHEQQADRAADAVVRGESAAPILGGGGRSSAAPAVQHKALQLKGGHDKKKDSSGLNDKGATQLAALQLRYAASAARAALADTSDKDAVRKGATLWMSRVGAATSSFSVGGVSANLKAIFPAVDAAYVLGAQLQEALGADTTSISVLAWLQALSDIVAAAGWKRPANAAAGKKRLAHAEKKGGKSRLSSGDKSSLCSLHLKAAQQSVLGGWDAVTLGKVDDVALSASNHLTSAHRMLLDPNIEDTKHMKAEIHETAEIVGRLVMWVEREGSDNTEHVLSAAQRLDSLLELVGEKPKWAAHVPKPKQATKDKHPDADKKPADDGKTKAPATHEPPDATQAMHRIVERREFTKRVKIEDTNYINEDLGDIELKMYAVKTGTGQVYVYRAVAGNELTGRAQQYLSMGADVTSYSFNEGGKRYCDTHFDVKIGGPGKTETSGVSIGLSAGLKNKAQTVEAGGSVSWQHSTATTSQGTAFFRRVFRVDSLTHEVKQIVESHDKDSVYGMKMAKSGMGFETVETKDFHGFELDDDDVGDSLTTFYANWILHSEDR